MRKVRRDEIVDYVTWRDDKRPNERASILALKKPRRVHVGEHLTFLFENADTVRYQVQEMMRVEQIVREDAIQHELDTYNELLGDAGELGCVLLIEIEDPEARDGRLREWVGLMDHVYAEVEGGERVPAIFDRRQVGDERLSSVQYIKFDTGGRVPVALGVDSPGALVERAELDAAQREALTADLAS